MTRRPIHHPEPDALPVVETTVNTPVFVDGVYTIDVDRRGLARLILTAEQREPQGGTIERVVALRLTLPRAVMAEVGARMVAAAEAAPTTGPEPEPRSGRPLN